ncbi:MAG: MarR family transcriptional regulator [Gordonia sp. (in: high G+C Gram-positive bacteria)]
MSPFRIDDGLAGALALIVVRLSRNLRSRREDQVVSLTQLSALSTLHLEGPMTPGALAAAERVKPPSMTRVIASLASLGMVRRAPHPTDGRQAIVTLSQDGEKIVVGEHAARRAYLSDQIDSLSGNERIILRAALPVLAKLIVAPGPATDGR